MTLSFLIFSCLVVVNSFIPNSNFDKIMKHALCVQDSDLKIEVVIMDINKSPKITESGFNMSAFVLQTPITTLFYVYVDPTLSLNRSIKILSHESVHIIQYVEGRLVTDTIHEIIFEKRKYRTYEIDYYDRPWEREAYGNQNRVAREVKKLLK